MLANFQLVHLVLSIQAANLTLSMVTLNSDSKTEFVFFFLHQWMLSSFFCYHTSINPALYFALNAGSDCSQWCLFFFSSHPSSAVCLFVSVGHVALALRWRQRSVLHWVVPPLRSGCESEAWFRHPRLPTHYFLSRIENERGWWLRARCFRPCEWLYGSVCVCSVTPPTQPRSVMYPVFVLTISVTLHTLCDLAVHWHLSSNQNKAQALLFVVASHRV